MNRFLSLLATSGIALAACTGAPRHPEFSGGYPVHDCPDHLSGQVKLQAEARPIELSTSTEREHSIPTTGALGRRLLVSVTPAGLRSEDRIVWSSLSVASYGGTFLGWDRLQTDAGVMEPWADPKQPAAMQTKREEILTVALSPGQVKIDRAARGKKDLSGMQSIDLRLMPGGTPVDDTMVRIPKLWRDDGTPLPVDAVGPQLVAVRHPPGLDVVEATLQLDFVVRIGRTGDEWSCSAETRVTLVDQNFLRQPFWDLGLASFNSSRRDWLALSDPAFGAVRLVFDSPASANALANWIRTTRSMRLGPYALGVFRQSALRSGRPFGPIDETMLPTLRPLTIDDIGAIAVGAVGEP
jgi:hypothetical protein